MYWKKWAAMHEQEELKEGTWLDPAQVLLLRKKAKGVWTERHRNVARKIFVEGGWTQKGLFEIGWSDISECQSCKTEEGTEKHRLYHCPEWHAGRRDVPESFRKWEQKAKTSKKEWKWQRGIVAHPLSESHFSVTKWESEKHRSWGVPVEVFKGHVATDGSLLGTMANREHVVGQWSWIMMKRMGLGCMAQWRQNLRSSAPSSGRS